MITIGGSTGALPPLQTILSALPADLPAAVAVVVHSGESSSLPEVLRRTSPLRVETAKDGAPIETGLVSVAPPDAHLLVENGRFRLSRGPRENSSRPAIDPLFRTAGRYFRSGAIGIILSGLLDDGSAGLFGLKARGGVAIVQEPNDAVAPDMPRNAMKHTLVDHVLPATEIGPLLIELVKRKKKGPPRGLRGAPGKEANGGRDCVSGLVCPDCSGPLTMRTEGTLATFECRIGHKFSPETLTQAHAEALERALWIAVRTLEERATVCRSAASSARYNHDQRTKRHLADKAEAAAKDAELVREIIGRL